MKKSLKYLALILLLLALAGLAGVRVWQASADKRQAAAKAPGAAATGRVVSVSVAEARAGQIRDELEISGSLKPKEQVDISSKVTGRLVRLSAQVGEFVRQGQTIAVLETDELAQQVRRAIAAQGVVEATLGQRRAELSSARSDLDRAKQLLDAGLISRQEFDTKRTAFQVFESQLALTKAQGEQAAAELNELKIRLDQMNIQAPISGYIAQRFVDIGAVLSPATPIVRLVNLNPLVVVANVPEQQLAKLRPGASAVVHVDAVGGTTFDGRVARIGPVLDPATRTAFVEIEIPNPNGLLRAEMFVRVNLDLPNMRNAVLIPREALVYRGDQAGVFVVEQERPSFRAIQTGVTEGQHVEVLGELAAGTRIVSRGASLLEEGDRIRVVEQKEADNVPDSSGKPTSSSPTAEEARRG